MGGIFFGIFTPTEAAAIGAFATLLLAIVRKQISWRGFIEALSATTQTSCMVMMIVAGATIFGHFMAVTRVPFELSAWAGSLSLPSSVIMVIIILIYLFGGCFMDAFALIMLTVPIFAPLAETLGFDLIWFGILFTILAEIGLVTPPFGLNLFVLQGVVPQHDLMVVARSTFPFVLPALALIVILTIFPELVLWLPSILY